MFSGSDSINMDAKGRIAIPTRYRDLLAEYCRGELVITTELSASCLTLSPLPNWNVYEASVAALPALDPLGEMLSRFVIGRAKPVQVDNSGRVLIPPELRDHASLDKKLVLVGRSERMEIWDETTWKAEEEKARERYLETLRQAQESNSDRYRNLGWK